MLPPLLRENANFRRYFFGQAVSLLGDQITLIALPLTAVLALHASAGQMGALTTAALVPNLIFSLHAGSWVDRRGDRRGVMLATDVGRGLLIAIPPAAWAVFARVPAAGLAQVLLTLGRQARVAEFVTSPRGPKKPRPRRASGAGTGHVATARLLKADRP